MLQAIVHGALGILPALQIVQRLQKEMVERQIGKAFRHGGSLRIDQLQFIALGQHQRRVRFGADANPVQARRRWLRAIGFHGNLETRCVQCGN